MDFSHTDIVIRIIVDIYKIDEIAIEIDDLYKQNQLFNVDIFKK